MVNLFISLVKAEIGKENQCFLVENLEMSSSVLRTGIKLNVILVLRLSFSGRLVSWVGLECEKDSFYEKERKRVSILQKGFYNASIYFKVCFAKHGNLLCVHYRTYLEIPILSAGSDILRKWQLNWMMRKGLSSYEKDH